MRDCAFITFLSFTLFFSISETSIFAQTTRRVPSQYPTIQAAIDATANGVTKPTDEIFTDVLTSLPIARLTAFAWGDYDNDGDLDILFTGLTESSAITKIYRNDAGTFVDFIVPIQAVSEGSVTWGDYDNDGDLDILLTGNNGTLENPSPVSIVYRNERGSFVDIGASLTGVFRSSVAWGDYDNDGDLDILLTGESKAGFISKIYRNDAGVFVDIADPILFGVRGSAVAWGDYDNDGDLDILLTGSGFISKIYRNDNGSFFDIAAPLVGIGAGSVAWGDYDSDGDLDILMSGYSSGEIFKIYRNDKGSFVDVTGSLNNTIWGKALWGDYDNDGDLDILLIGAHVNGTQYSKIYRNDGGNFIDIAALLLGVRDGFAAWGDYDNDGDLDILLTGSSNKGPIAKIYQNNIGKPNTVCSSCEFSVCSSLPSALVCEGSPG